MVNALALRQPLCYTLASFFLLFALYASVTLVRLISASGARSVWTRQKSVHALVFLAATSKF